MKNRKIQWLKSKIISIINLKVLLYWLETTDDNFIHTQDLPLAVWRTEDFGPLRDGSFAARASSHSVCSPQWPGSLPQSDLSPQSS